MKEPRPVLSRMDLRAQGLFDRLFEYEAIPAGSSHPTVLHRWIVARAFGWGLYIHHFVQSENRDLHDHPRTFTTIGLKGRYIERYAGRAGVGAPESREYRAPWIRHFKPEHTHSVSLHPGETCWTLVIVGPKKQRWGFMVPRERAAAHTEAGAAAGNGDAERRSTAGHVWIDESVYRAHGRMPEETGDRRQADGPKT